MENVLDRPGAHKVNKYIYSLYKREYEQEFLYIANPRVARNLIHHNQMEIKRNVIFYSRLDGPPTKFVLCACLQRFWVVIRVE